jgi:hypothetical protein
MEPSLFDQILSVVGALLVLVAYAANLAHKIEHDSALYAGMNLAGASALTYVAVHSGALGLILVEAAWAAVSLVALVRAIARG